MDAQKILEAVQAYKDEFGTEDINLYDFATRIAEAQREQTALVFEALGFGDIAAKVRGS